jgi:DNA-nicking Smr family endonuclease
MTGDRPRRLSADEHKLWRSVTRAIKPLKPARPREDAPEAPDAKPAGDRRSYTLLAEAKPLPAKKGPTVPSLAPLERRLCQRLAKGHAAIDGRLDLHGLTQREAHDTLVRFLRAAQAKGARIVLVVTGKGRESRGSERDPFAERGVLRRLVPQWLNAPELRRVVVGFEAAHIGHGGEGALYVQLRRARE